MQTQELFFGRGGQFLAPGGAIRFDPLDPQDPHESTRS
jgi:hypothetical protein